MPSLRVAVLFVCAVPAAICADRGVRIIPVNQFGRPANGCTAQVTLKSGEAQVLSESGGVIAIPRAPTDIRRTEVLCSEGTAERDELDSTEFVIIPVGPIVLNFDHIGHHLSMRVNGKARELPGFVELVGVSVPEFRAAAAIKDGNASFVDPQSGLYTSLFASAETTCIANLEIADSTSEWTANLNTCSVHPDKYAIVLGTSEASEIERHSWEARIQAEQQSIIDALRNIQAATPR